MKLITKLVAIVFFVLLISYISNYILIVKYNIQSLSALKYSMILTLIMLVLALWIFTKKQITDPILRLTDASKSVQKGIQHWVGTALLSKSLSINHNDEIGELASSFSQLIHELGEKERIRSILGKVVSKQVANELITKKAKLKGEKKNAVILFVDIRDFTHYSESLEPSDVLLMLNIAFAGMASIIERNHGIVDKYIGDAVMALFGIPIESNDNEYNAINTALEIMESLGRINTTLTTKGLPIIDIGIGINSGSVVAGNIGSDNRQNYTVIGNDVNLASRLQNLNKVYCTHIIVSDAVKRKTAKINYRFIDIVRTKTTLKPMVIYEPIGLKDESNNALTKELDKYDDALMAYKNKDWQSASLIFSQLYNIYQNKLYDVYHRRCNHFLTFHPSHDWDGVYNVDQLPDQLVG